MRKILDKFGLGEIEVPGCVKEQLAKFFLLGFAMLLIGIVITIVSFNWFTLIATILLALIIAGIGFVRLREITRKGYQRIEGECRKIEYTLASRAGGNITKDIPKRYLIYDGEDTYAIPYYRHNPQLAEGDHVVMYLKFEPDTFEWQGVRTPSVIYGYEVTYSNEEKEDSE